MVLFGVLLKSAENSFESYFEQLKNNLGGKNIAKNPFMGGVHRVNRNFYVVEMRPIYPNPIYGAFFLLVPSLLFHWFYWSWWHLPGLLLLFASYFYSRHFFFWMLKKGLRKKGYVFGIEMFNDQDTIKKVVEEWDNMKSKNGLKQKG